MDFLRLSIIKIMIDNNYCKNNVDNSKKVMLSLSVNSSSKCQKEKSKKLNNMF